MAHSEHLVVHPGVLLALTCFSMDGPALGTLWGADAGHLWLHQQLLHNN